MTKTTTKPKKQLMRGTEAIGEAAIRAGCRFYAGYPITPQNELPEYMARRMGELRDEHPEENPVFIQSESEISAINMLLGASVTGARVMTSSSSPGISLKQEGISFMAGQELPAVIVNIMRGGPGLGNIAPSQADYYQATRGGGHGDYRTPVLAPATVQEMADLTYEAFDIADKYRTPVLIVGDGMMGQMMEPVVFGPNQPMKMVSKLPAKSWALRGSQGKPSRFNRSLILPPDEMEDLNWRLYRKYQKIERNEIRVELIGCEGADFIVVAYGTAARIAKSAVKRCQEKGLKVGLIRPITLWPYPTQAIRQVADSGVTGFLTFELNMGQMVDDVRLAVEGRAPVEFFGRPGGPVPTPADLTSAIRRTYNKMAKKN
jgi:2-oxoglutarate ferredoxin oxidoreductase subunit alpha